MPTTTVGLFGDAITFSVIVNHFGRFPQLR